MKMKWYLESRNVFLILIGILATVYLVKSGMPHGAEVVKATEINVGVMWGGITGAVFGRGYCKKQEISLSTDPTPGSDG